MLEGIGAHRHASHLGGQGVHALELLWRSEAEVAPTGKHGRGGALEVMVVVLVPAHIDHLVVSLVVESVVVRDLGVRGKVGPGRDATIILTLVEAIGDHGTAEEDRE